MANIKKSNIELINDKLDEIIKIKAHQAKLMKQLTKSLKHGKS